MKSIEELNLRNGPTTTPVAVAHRMTELSRGTGRTTQLVESLPDDGKAVILVSVQRAKEYLFPLIRNVRGWDYPIEALRLFTYDQWKTGDPRVRGLKPLPAFVENDVLDRASIELVQDVNKMFHYDQDTRECYRHFVGERLSDAIEEITHLCSRVRLQLVVSSVNGGAFTNDRTLLVEVDEHFVVRRVS